MSKSLVYVDKDRIIGVAVPFIGSEFHITKQTEASGGFSWLLQGEVSKTRQEGIYTRIQDLLPQTIVNKLIEQFPKELTFTDVDECTKKLKEWENEDNIGKSIIVKGIFSVTGITTPALYDPFNPQDFSSIKTVSYNGEECIIGQLSGDGVRLPVYMSKNSLNQGVAYCNNQYVEILGVLGFSPWYDVGKNRTINTVLSGIALWVN